MYKPTPALGIAVIKRHADQQKSAVRCDPFCSIFVGPPKPHKQASVPRPRRPRFIILNS